MTLETSVLFSSRSLCSRLRRTLRAEQKLRGLFQELAERVAKTRQDEALGLRSVSDVPLLSRVFMAGSPQSPLACAEGPSLRLRSGQRLELRFRLSQSQGRACRAWLFDARTLARLWHAFWCRHLWYEAAKFDARPPAYDRAQQRLVVPSQHDAESPQILLRLPPGQLRSAVALADGAFVAVDRSGVLILGRPGQEPTTDTPDASRWVRYLTSMPDGRRVVSAGQGGAVQIWQTDGTGEVVRIESSTPLIGVLGMPGDRVGLVRWNGIVAIHDATQGALREEVPLSAGCGTIADDELEELTALAPSGEAGLLVGTVTGSIATLPANRPVSRRRSHCGAIHRLVELPDGRRWQVSGDVTTLHAMDDRILASYPETFLGHDPQGRALFAAERDDGTDLVRRDLDRSIDLDGAIARCFREDHADTLHSARILAATAELNGTLGTDGEAVLSAEIPGWSFALDERDLAEHLFVVIAVEG